MAKTTAAQVIIFNDELPSVLAALRHFQRLAQKEKAAFPHFEDHPPLANAEIDALCERLNAGGDGGRG